MITISNPLMARLGKQLVGGRQKFLSRFETFFTAYLQQDKTRSAYASALKRFANWCSQQGLLMQQLQYRQVATYADDLLYNYASSSVRQHLAALHMLYDWLMIDGLIPANPVPTMRIQGLKASVPPKTPTLSLNEVQQLLAAFKCDNVSGLRNRAMVGVILYAFAPLVSLINLRRGDYFTREQRPWLRLKLRGRINLVPLHPQAAAYLEAYLNVAALNGKQVPLFPRLNRHRKLTRRQLDRHEVFEMTKRASRHAQLSAEVTPLQLRLTGVTALIQAGLSIDKVSRLAGHKSQRTTECYQETVDVDHTDLAQLFESSAEMLKPLQDFVKRTGIFQVSTPEK